MNSTSKKKSTKKTVKKEKKEKKEIPWPSEWELRMLRDDNQKLIKRIEELEKSEMYWRKMAILEKEDKEDIIAEMKRQIADERRRMQEKEALLIADKETMLQKISALESLISIDYETEKRQLRSDLDAHRRDAETQLEFWKTSVDMLVDRASYLTETQFNKHDETEERKEDRKQRLLTWNERNRKH